MAAETPIDDFGAIPEQMRRELKRRGIDSLEQFVGAIAAVGGPAAMATLLGIGNEQAFRNILSIVRSELTAAEWTYLNAPVDTSGMGTGANPPAGGAPPRAADTPPAPGSGLPDKVAPLNGMPEIRLQGSRPTCVAFALTAVHDFITRDNGKPNNFSEQHLYYEAKKIDGNSAPGTTVFSGITALMNRGQCLETTWPYDKNKTGTPPDKARKEGEDYKLTLQQVGIGNAEKIQTRLAANKPVVISIPVYKSWYKNPQSKRSGKLTMPLKNESAYDYHSLCIVGYKNSEKWPGGGYFILRHTWKDWGKECKHGKGLGMVPYAYTSTYAFEVYSLP